MKPIFTILMMIATLSGLQAQIAPASVCTSSSDYTFDEEVSWYYDLSGNDLAIAGDTLYFWSWEPNTPPDGAAPLIHVKDKTWKLTWTPTEYYGVDVSVLVSEGNSAFWHAIQDKNGNAVTGTVPYETKELLRTGSKCDCVGAGSDSENMYLVNFTTAATLVEGEDTNGNHWTNVTSAIGSFALLDTGSVHRYDVAISGSFLTNDNSDFTTPDTEKLGELAESNATASYLYLESGNSGMITISCLDPNHSYALSILGSRNATGERVTSYTINGVTTETGDIQTTGTGLGSGSCTNCNDDELFEATMYPDESGKITILVETNGSYGYINALKVVESVPDLTLVTSITVSGDDITTAEGTSQMTAEISPVAASIQSVKWAVLPTNLATIDESGLLTAKGNGTVTVTATSQDGSGVSGSTEIQISNQLYSVQQVFLVDFGTSANTTSSPDSYGNHWTNFTDGSSHAMTNTGGEVSSLVISEDSDLGSFPGNTGGLSGPGAALGDLAISSVTEDYFTSNNIEGAIFYLDNLDPEKIYKFSIFATRQSTTGRITQYEIEGSTLFTEQLVVSGNTAGLVTSPYLFPNDTGAFKIHLTSVGESDFVYIGGLIIEEVVYEGATATAVEISAADIAVPGATSPLSAVVTRDGIGIDEMEWSLSNDSIAYLSAEGVLFPKANGTVDVIGKVAMPGGPSDTITVTVSNQILGDMYAFGDGLEGDPDGTSLENSILMKQQPGENGVLTGVFTTFSEMDNTGAFQFYHIQGDTAVYYGVDDDGLIVQGGSALAPSSDWVGPVRLRVNLSESSYEVVWDYELTVKGNGTAGAWGGDGVSLAYAGNGIWADTVDFTYADAPEDATYFRFYIEANDNYGNYKRYQKLANSRNTLVQDFPDESGGGSFTTIDLNQGVYVISVNLQDMTFGMENTIQVEDGLAFMGSSVCAGYPIPTATGPYKGYAYMYDSLLQQRYDDGKSEVDWTTVNISIGGNSTHDVSERFEEHLVPSGMSYVWYGLALANQGLISATDKDALVEDYMSGLEELIADAQAIGITPVVSNTYPNGYYDDEYEYVVDANIEMAQWDVPTINLLGALDDGTGKWVPEYQAILGSGGLDGSHPNSAGYKEMFYTIVPSLFDALKAGKAQPEKYSEKSLEINETNAGKIYTYTPDGTVHAFTASVKVKTTGSGDFLSFTSGDSVLTVSINAADGSVNYGTDSGVLIDGNTAVNDGQWHTISLTHYFAAAKTILYVDGEAEGNSVEHIVVTQMDLNSANVTNGTTYSNLFFYRSGMTQKEISFVADDTKILKSSLELYAPLDGTNELPLLTNLAQSTTTLKVSGELNQDASLTDLRVNDVSVSGFDSGVLSYDVELPYSTNEIPRINVTLSDHFATYEITNATALPGTTIINVTAEDTSVSKIYTVNFTLASPGTDATLFDLTIDGETVSGFDPGVTEYTMELVYGETTVPTVEAIANDTTASVVISAATELPGSTSVTVTAEDGSTEMIYTVFFAYEALADDATLSGIIVQGDTLSEFDPAVTSYSIELPYAQSEVPQVEAYTVDTNASVEIVAATGLPGTTQIIVTAQDPSVQLTYVVNFTLEAPATDATLSDLSVDGATITDFDPAVADYMVMLPYSEEIVPQVSATSADVNASLEITAATSLPGVTSVIVTAQDMTVQMTYTVTFELVEPSADATLSDLTVNGESIEGFSPEVTDYEVVLPSGTKAVPTIAGVPTDDNATITGGYAVSLPGTSSLKVTAEDGTTSISYTVSFSAESVLSVDTSFPMIYPNPAIDHLYFRKDFVDKKVSIYNLTGLLIFNTQPTNGRIDVSMLNPGIYFLMVDSKKIKFIKK